MAQRRREKLRDSIAVTETTQLRSPGRTESRKTEVSGPRLVNSSGIPLEKDPSTPNNGGVSKNFDIEELKKQIERTLSAHNVDPGEVDQFEQLVDSLVALTAGPSGGEREAADDQPLVIDAESGLALPPPPVVSYSDWVRKNGHVTASEFLKDQYKDYLTNSLLYLEHVKQGNRSLYDALRAEAHQAGQRTIDFFRNLGIFTSDDLRYPPEGKERQAAILKTAQLRQAARTRELRAAAIQVRADRGRA